VKKVKSDTDMVTYALLLIDGILEDNRSRIHNLVNIQKSHNKAKKEDLIALLNSFLLQNHEKSNEQRDLAAHIQAMLIEAVEYKNCSADANAFMDWLLSQKTEMRLSLHAYTFSLMYLLKTNELAKIFVQNGGFQLFAGYLENECIRDH
jgi:hypothetical protein